MRLIFKALNRSTSQKMEVAMRRSICFSLLCFGLALIRTTAADTAREVAVSQPVVREVTDYVDFTGRTQAVNLVNVIARVSGYLVKEPFKEGSDVKAGDLLFEIDPRPYQAQFDVALAKVNQSKTQLRLAQVVLARDEQVSRATPGSVGSQQIDQDRAAVDEAQSQINVAQAALEPCKLNLDFCKVTSPIDGLASRYYLTPGNLVTRDQTVLTTIVSLDPIYTYVDIDEPTVLRIRRAVSEGRMNPIAAGHIPVLMGLQNEDGFPRKGVVDFINNQVNPATGSVPVRGVFANPLLPGGQRMMMPGMFVRIRLPIGQPHKALLVTERAIGSDQGLKFVYVVNDRGEIEHKRIETGPLESDGLRVVTNGLNANDRVVVSRLKQVRPGVKVQTEVVPMPLLDGRGAESSKVRAGALPADSVPGGVPPAGAAAAGDNQPPGAGNQEAPKKRPDAGSR
jgi:multidrug efflux system membrane fusion protein